MNNEKILKKVIEKAGLTKKYEIDGVMGLIEREERGSENAYWRQIDINKLIFSHDFLKAFFGNERVCLCCGTPESNKEQIGYCKDAWKAECVTPFEWNIAWKYHGCKMLLERNPLLYIKKHI